MVGDFSTTRTVSRRDAGVGRAPSRRGPVRDGVQVRWVEPIAAQPSEKSETIFGHRHRISEAWRSAPSSRIATRHNGRSLKRTPTQCSGHAGRDSPVSRPGVHHNLGHPGRPEGTAPILSDPFRPRCRYEFLRTQAMRRSHAVAAQPSPPARYRARGGGGLSWFGQVQAFRSARLHARGV